MTSTSADLFARARAVMPGGVSSPVRAFGAVGGVPRFVAWARGSRVVDVEGRSYVDLVGGWGPMILGHAHPEVVAAVQAAVARSASFGAPCLPELELAEEIVRRVAPVERVRFTSSGTEAVMTAVRLASSSPPAPGWPPSACPTRPASPHPSPPTPSSSRMATWPPCPSSS